jgi:hypothetical protein
MYRKLNFLSSVLILSIITIYLFAFSHLFNPDYVAYERIFNENANGLQDPLFRFLVRTLNDIGDYSFFRVALLGVLLILTLISVSLSSKILLRAFSLVGVLVLAPFLVLKVHVQIREACALIFLLLFLSCSVHFRHGRFLFLIFFLLSINFHASSALWYLIYLFPAISSSMRKWFAVFLGLLMGIGASSFGEIALSNFTGGLYFVLGYDPIKLTTGKIIYFATFPGIFLYTYLILRRQFVEELSKSRQKLREYLESLQIIGMLFGSVFLATTVALPPSENTFNNVLRIFIGIGFISNLTSIILQVPTRIIVVPAVYFATISFRLIFFPSLGS